MPKDTGSNYPNDRYHSPLWLQLVLHATRFVVFIHSYLRESRKRVGREPLRRLALYRLLSNQPSRVDEELTQIVCAACKSTIGLIHAADDVREVAEEIAEAHYDYCTATEEERQQAIYDMEFRKLIEELGL